MHPAALALSFVAVLVVELPDKTFLATLVLATRYRPLPVWVGVALAFTVQTAVAVLLGGVASLLPADAVRAVSLTLFVLGAVILLRQGLAERRATGRDAGDDAGATVPPATGVRVVVTAFLVLFAAEWGDLSQLLTISLVARYDAPVSVFVGALAALLMVSGLAVAVGRRLTAWAPVHALQFVGAGVCVVLAVLTAAEIGR